MKRRLLVLWVCLLVFLAGVAMCGAAGYKRGYIGGYGGRDGLRAGYAPGVGGGAGTDTIPADVTAPPAPAGLTAVGRDGDVLVSWTAAGQTQSVKYRVYRYFDGSPEVLLVASTVSTGAVDRTAVNGSRHNYFVLAIDNAGNISESSAVVSATPGTILSIPRPAYFAFWYQDPGVSSFSQATIDSLSAFDAIVTGPFALEGNTSEPAYNAGPGLLRRLRSASGDSTILLTYFNAQTIPADGGAYPVGSAIRRITNYCASLSDADGDSAGFGRRTNNTVATGTTYSTKFYNVSKTTLADTIAFHLVEVFDGMKVDGEYAGFFLDDADTTLSDWMITAGAQAVIDFDGNESVYEANGTELALFKAFQIDLVRAIRREFAERGMANRLLVFNGTWGRKAVPHLQDDEYTGLMDGALNEGWNRYGWPGSATMAGNAATNTGTWDLALSWGEQFPLAQTSPPLMFWNSHADSNYQYMNEVVTMAYNGFAGAQTDGDAHGTAHAPTMRRRLPLQTTLGVASYDTVAGNVSPDTLTVHTGPYDGRMVLGQAYEDTTGIWPYAITDNTKTPGQAGYYISRSAFWVIPAEVGAPAGLQFDTVPGDRTVTVYWNDPTEGDVDYFRIYRGVYNSVDSLDLFIQNPPAARVATTWQWTDATFTCNDSTYYYSVTAVDYSGNESAVDDISACTPVDGVAPTVPQNVIASGGSHYIDLDWSNSSAADLTGYYVARAPNAAGDVAGTYTARYDSVAISAYQDSTALSGDRFWYKVRAYDDDGNISDYSTAVDGSWSAPVVGAPTSLVAQANTPSQGSTYLSWSAPSDVTTLESYTLYRDRSAPYDSVYATGITSNTKIDTKATQDSTFYYSVTAVYDPGGESAHSNVVSMKNTDTVPPLTPDLQIAAGNGVNGIDLNWTDSAGAVMYYVFRGEFVATTKIDSTSASNYLDTNTIQGYTYRYRIKARDSAWNVSAQSNMLSASWVPSPSGNPTIATVSGGTVQHGEAVTLAGTGFGLKAAAAPVVWDNLEDGTVNTAATVGTWGTTTSLTPSSVSRHANSQWSAGYNFISSTSGGEELAYFQGGSPSPKWFAQYWFYLDQDFAFGPTLVSNLGNVKMFRMSNPGGSALNNVRVTTSGRYDIQIVSEYRDQSHDWHPVVPGFDWIDQIFGHANPGYVDPSYLGWKQFESDITTGTWHLFQFQFSESSMNGYDGTLKWWMDGKLIFTTSALPTRWDAQPTSFRIKELGFYNSAGGGGDYTNHFNIDDAYIDNSWARVELGNASTYAACTHREVQPPTEWTPTSVSVTANTGSFANGAAYLFVVAEDGTVSTGKAVEVSNGPTKVLFSHQSIGRNVVFAENRFETSHTNYTATARIRSRLNSNIEFWDHDYNSQWGGDALLAPDGLTASSGYGDWRLNVNPNYSVGDVGLMHLVGKVFTDTPGEIGGTASAVAFRDAIVNGGFNTVIIKPGYRDVHMPSGLAAYQDTLTAVSSWWATNMPGKTLCIMTAPPLRSPLVYSATNSWTAGNIATAISEVAAYKQFCDWLTTTWVGLSPLNKAIDIFTPLTNRSAVGDGINFMADAYETTDNHLNRAGSNIIQDLMVDFLNGTASPPAPVANFGGTPLTGTAPLTVAFTDSSTNTPTQWAWTFGDAATASTQNPSHQYAAAGTYTVSMTATNAYGADALTRTSYVTVSAVGATVANFSGTPTSGVPPLAVTFTDLSTNSPTSWLWAFGDGATSTLQSPSHTYAEGTYTVELTAAKGLVSDTETKTGYIVAAAAGRDTTGLLALYNFDEAAGDTVYDVSGRGVPLNLVIGALSTSAEWRTGANRGLHTLSPEDAGLDESGTTPPNIRSPGAATKLYNAITASDALTFEVWITPSAEFQWIEAGDGYANSARRIVSFGNNSTDNALLTHCSQASGSGDAVLWRPRNGTASGVYGPNNTMNTDTLIHIVGTKAAGDASSYKIYVNGSVVSTTQITQAAALTGWVSTDKLAIANRNYTTAPTDCRPWWGTIHLLAIYNRALSAAEVADNYTLGF